MNATIKRAPGGIGGTITAPPSKSMAHRAVLCSALAEGASHIENLEFSKDISATLSAAGQLCAKVRTGADRAIVEGLGSFLPVSAPVDCCESGSTLRFLIPIASLTGQKVTFVGRGRLMERPQTVYEKLYQEQSLRFEQSSEGLTVEGTLKSSEYELAGNVSSQFISGLLFALPLLDGDSEIRMLSKLESKPYVDLTIACLRHFGIAVQETEQGYAVAGGQQYHACDLTVEGDYSQAAFFCVANALGSDITLTNLNPESVQGDKKIVEIVREMCYNREQGLPAGFTVDAADIPDLVPILAVLATFGTAPSSITGAHRLAIKESDRLASTADLLNRLGGKVTATPDGLEIEPVEQLHGGTVDSCGDHRIAMCAAVAATRCAGEVTILHGECVEKSYPRFYEDYRQLGGIANVIVLES